MDDCNEVVEQGCSDDAVILDPTAAADAKPFELAPRSGKITGTLGLFDISKPGGSTLLDYYAERMSKEHPGIKVVRFVKDTFARVAPDKLRQAVVSQCDYVILALAD